MPRRRSSEREKNRAPGQRQLRVGEELRHLLAQLLERGNMHDHDLRDASITVTSVDVSPLNWRVVRAPNKAGVRLANWSVLKLFNCADVSPANCVDVMSAILAGDKPASCVVAKAPRPAEVRPTI